MDQLIDGLSDQLYKLKSRKSKKDREREWEREREREKERKKERKGTIGYDLKWSKLSSYLVHLVQWDEGKEGTEE